MSPHNSVVVREVAFAASRNCSAPKNFFSMDNILRGTVPRKQRRSPASPSDAAATLSVRPLHSLGKLQQQLPRVSPDSTTPPITPSLQCTRKDIFSYQNLLHMQAQKRIPASNECGSESSAKVETNLPECRSNQFVNSNIGYPPVNSFSNYEQENIRRPEHNYRYSPPDVSPPGNDEDDIALEDIIVDQSSSSDDDEDLSKSDSDSSGNSSSSRNLKKKRRVLFSKFQTRELLKRFGTSWYISSQERDALAKQLNMDPDQVKIWFQNHRYKVKKMYKDVGERPGGPQIHPIRPYPLPQRDPKRHPAFMRDLIMHNHQDPYYQDFLKEQLYLESTRPLSSEYFPNNMYPGALQGLKGVGFPTTPYPELADIFARSQYGPGRTFFPPTHPFSAYEGIGSINPLANYMLGPAQMHSGYPKMMSPHHLSNPMQLGVTI